jgi:NTE family protein
VAVVLGGGGARGLAHLGVLRYMEELGIPVDMIGGTSMGGLVAGLYSFGYGQEYLDSLVRAIDWTTMMSDRVPDDYLTYRVRHNKERFFIDIPFHYEKEGLSARVQRQLEIERMYSKVKTRTSDMGQEAINKIGLGLPDGFLFGYNVRNTLSSVSVGYQDSLTFDRMPIPFYCVATDMVSMKEKNWTEGHIVDAMRSTMAIPLYFRPVRIDNMVLTDGGTRNNFPVDVAREMGADIVIGSEMPVHRTLTDLNTLANLAQQNITMMSSDAALINRENTDLLLQHELPGYTMLSFDTASVADIIEQGYALAKENAEAFAAIARRVQGNPAPLGVRKHAVDIGRQDVLVHDIRIEGIPEKEQKYLIDPLFLQRDGYYNRTEVERILAMIYGTRAFESVTYRLEGSGEPYTLVFDCQKGQTHEFSAGVHVDNDEVVYASLRLGLNTRKLYGPRFTTELKIGNNATAIFDFAYKPLRHLPTVGISTKTSYLNLTYHDMGLDAKIKAINTRFDAYIEDSRFIYGNFRMGYSFDLEPYENYLDPIMWWKDYDFKSNWHSVFATLRADTLDDGYFPTLGFRGGVNGRFVFGGYSVYLEDYETLPDDYFDGPVQPYATVLLDATAALPLGERFTLQPMVYAGWNSRYNGMMNLMHTVTAGGTVAGRYMDYQIPFFGYGTSFHLMQRFSLMARTDLRWQFSHVNYLSLQVAHLRNSHYIQDLFHQGFGETAIGLEFGRKTVAGPLLLGAHWCQDRGFGVTLGFGLVF